jgi:hypothetical protein
VQSDISEEPAASTIGLRSRQQAPQKSYHTLIVTAVSTSNATLNKDYSNTIVRRKDYYYNILKITCIRSFSYVSL